MKNDIKQRKDIRQSTTIARIKKAKENLLCSQDDVLAVEEPLEIRLGYYREGQRKNKNISVTMRTPGNDFELAAGFLFSEGIISNHNQIDIIKYVSNKTNDENQGNTVFVLLKNGVEVDMMRLERHFYTSSSCGVCGKTSIDAIEVAPTYKLDTFNPVFSSEVIHQLPSQLRNAQSVFGCTGGLHGAGLFDSTGKLATLREDVGRHNAVDKLIGSQLIDKKLPLSEYLLMLSGRASFELVQKAVVAGIPVVAAVGAPSSLAVDLAKSSGITLLGFVRNRCFNIYSGVERIKIQDT